MQAIRSTKYLILIPIALMILFVGCSKGTPPDEHKGMPSAEESAVEPVLEKAVAVGSQWYGHIPVWIGIEKGIFRQHGFDHRHLV